MDMTIIEQGSFTSTGAATTLILRSDVDWVSVINYTVAAADQTDPVGVQYYWQRGMAAGTGIIYLKSEAAQADNLIQAMTTGGFTLVDSSVNIPGPSVALTAVSNANPPAVTTGSTATLSDGDIVRIIDVTGAQQLGGYDFTVNVVDGTHFQLEFMVPIAAGTNGFWRRIPYNPYFYPRTRYISAITQAANAVVTMTVTHGFTVGQKVRLQVPAAFGMTQINGLTGTILAVNTGTNTITLDIDSTAFTAFDFPLTAAVPFTPAAVIPVGEAATSPFENLLDDATRNTAYIGIELGAGEEGPAGSDGDLIYWRAGKSFSNTNE